MAVCFKILLVCLSLQLVSAKHSKDALDILIMGDFGGNNSNPFTTAEEVSSAKYMAKIGSKYDAEMVWSVGDNIYDNGVTDEYDSRFVDTFESVFSQNVPFYMVAGNHDHYGNVSGQIAYTQHSQRWKFPDFYYTKTWNISTSNTTVQLIMLDTILLCGLAYDSLQQCEQLSVPAAQCYVRQPSFDVYDAGKHQRQMSDAAEQWKWLNDELNASTAHYLFVAGHYPVWNVGEHQNTDCLVAQLRPLLLEYNVTMYINGHSHTMEYIVEDDHAIPFVTSGATHVCDLKTYNLTVPEAWVKYHGCGDGGFNRLHINDSAAFMEFYNGNSTDVQFVSPLLFPRI